jgi:GNAT superfamily N-acetyltransferase
LPLTLVCASVLVSRRADARSGWLAGVDRRAVLTAFDEQIRRHPTPEGRGGRVEHDFGVTRCIGGTDGWNGVTWSELDDGNADAVIAAQVSRFAEVSAPWEWKHYSYDEPPDLPDRLIAAGFTREPAEALLVAEIADLTLDVSPPAGVELRAVVDEQGVESLVSVHDEVFGVDHSGLGRALLDAVTRRSSAVAAVIAVAGQTPIAAGRVEFHSGTDFASLWGGGTLPAWRGRGVFRSLVAHRAALASARGFRYLEVDASPESRPILQRLGFVELATTTPFVHPGTSRAAPRHRTAQSRAASTRQARFS